MGRIVNLQWFYSDFTMQYFVKASAPLRCRRVVVAKIGFDTAENRPRKGLKKPYHLKGPNDDEPKMGPRASPSKPGRQSLT